MTTASAVATNIRIVTATCAIVAAATLGPAAVANATPAAPLPAAGIGSTLGGVTVTPCAPHDLVCAGAQFTSPFAAPGNPSSAAIGQNPLVWLGSPANPNFQPIFGIAFPSFGLNFEACFLGAAIHLSPYGTGFIGLGLGC
jgi:hypothetical protein